MQYKKKINQREKQKKNERQREEDQRILNSSTLTEQALYRLLKIIRKKQSAAQKAKEREGNDNPKDESPVTDITTSDSNENN